MNVWLVVEPTPLKNMSSSVGMMKFLIYLEKHVPNHQPDVEHLKMGNNMGLCSTGICKRLSVGVPSNIFEPEKKTLHHYNPEKHEQMPSKPFCFLGFLSSQ